VVLLYTAFYILVEFLFCDDRMFRIVPAMFYYKMMFRMEKVRINLRHTSELWIHCVRMVAFE
jgi:hypothetical protein